MTRGLGVTDEAGATAVEYALMAGLIAVVIATAVAAAGQSLTAMFTGFNDVMGWG
jgi:pilus assembly protein Flp/PilA